MGGMCGATKFMIEEIKITIPELPPTDNHLYFLRALQGQKQVIKFMSAEGKEWKELASYCGRQGYRGEILTCPLKVKIWFYLKRERDIQGSLKVLFDSFEGIIYKDDKQVIHFEVDKILNAESKINPRVEIIIYE